MQKESDVDQWVELRKRAGRRTLDCCSPEGLVVKVYPDKIGLGRRAAKALEVAAGDRVRIFSRGSPLSGIALSRVNADEVSGFKVYRFRNGITLYVAAGQLCKTISAEQLGVYLAVLENGRLVIDLNGPMLKQS